MTMPVPMDPDRWRLIARLVSDALERPTSERAAYLREACADDAGLQAEVESLLAQESSADAFFARGAADVFGETSGSAESPGTDLPAGTKLGAYQIERPIGHGGMGAVFLAVDTVLQRPAAIKIVEEKDDGASHRALLREARNASTLSHPNICTVYEVGETGGRAYIAMEYVDGGSLGDVLRGGPLRLEDTLRYGLEVSDALAHAHERGVIHRDLKPANVMLTSSGHVKIVDFGLARRLDAHSADATTTTASSHAGVVRGTPHAMAPEQVRGGATDERTDIWALGVVLYQMATAKKPFRGPTVVDLFSSILRDEPATLPATVPAPLRHVILRCLAKDPRRRYGRASEVHAALTAIASASQIGFGSLSDDTTRTSASEASRRVRVISRRGLVLALLLTVLGGLAVWIAWPAGQRGRAIAILPLVNMSGASQDALVDGMTDGIINSLGRVAAVKVIARTSVMPFKGTHKSAAAIAAELGVDTVLEGTATLMAADGGERIRVTINLIDPRSQTVVWSDMLERDLGGVLALQGELARHVAAQVNAGVTANERRALDDQQRVNPDAYKLYALGRQAWNQRTAASLATAVRYFEQAIAIAPDYAQAHAGLADSYVLLAGDFGAMARDQGAVLAVSSATRALQLDPTLAEAHTSLAFAHFFLTWEFELAGREFQTALGFNPSYATLHQWYGNYLSDMGREDEGLEQMRQALVLDPLSPIISRDVAWPLFFSGRYDEAIGQLNDTLTRHAGYVPAERLLARTYAQRGSAEEAIPRYESLRQRDGSARAICELAWAYAKAGRRADAEHALAEARAKTSEKLYPYDLALVFAALNQPDDALRELRRAYDERDATLVNLRHDPRLASLRADPRYATLLALMHFPK